MNKQTKTIIDRARALLAYATPGPWAFERNAPFNNYVVGCSRGTAIALVSRTLAHFTMNEKRAMAEHDAALITAAPSMLADLCDALESAEAEVNALRAELVRLRKETA